MGEKPHPPPVPYLLKWGLPLIPLGTKFVLVSITGLYKKKLKKNPKKKKF